MVVRQGRLNGGEAVPSRTTEDMNRDAGLGHASHMHACMYMLQCPACALQAQIVPAMLSPSRRAGPPQHYVCLCYLCTHYIHFSHTRQWRGVRTCQLLRNVQQICCHTQTGQTYTCMYVSLPINTLCLYLVCYNTRHTAFPHNIPANFLFTHEHLPLPHALSCPGCCCLSTSPCC